MDKFRVGDRVKIISLDNNCSGHGIGYEFVIQQISHQQIYTYYREYSGIADGVRESSLELVRPADKSNIPWIYIK